MAAPWKSRGALVSGAVVLVALATVAAWTQRAPFPLLNDDVAYLGGACGMGRLDALEWGPAYATLYCGWTHAVADPFTAFWLKQAAVLLLAGFLVDRLARRFGVGPVVAPLSALWCVLALLLPNGTLEFAFVLGLLACVLAASDTPGGWAGFFVATGFAFFVRTEYAVGILAAVLLLSWRARRSPAARPAAVVGVVVLAACCAVAWGRVPGAGGRSWFAFGQQFAVNHTEAHPSDADPLVDWQRIAAQSFPTSRSISQAARENPRVFSWHVGHNVAVRLPRALVRLVLPVPAVARWPSPWNAGLGLVALLAVLLTALLGANEVRRTPAPGIAALAALAVIPAVSLLFRPQARHLLPLVPLLVVLCGRGLATSSGRVRHVLSAVLLGVLVTAAIAPWTFWMRAPRPATSLAGRLRDLRDEARTRPVRVRASWYADRVCTLVGGRCVPVSIDAGQADVVFLDAAGTARPEVQAGCVADPPEDGVRFVRCPAP